MENVIILFGGGDGGGIRITPTGIKPIPPFDPFLKGQLEATSKLVNGAVNAPKKFKKEIEVSLGKVSEIAIGELMAHAGFKGDSTIVYSGFDGEGFTCGTPPGRRPPIPLPRPR